MKLDDLSKLIGILNELDGDTSHRGDKPSFKVGEKVIVRSVGAGVLYGEYVSRVGADVQLRNAVQLWKWFAAKGHTLIDVATYGVDPSKCKFSPGKTEAVILGACSIIAVSPEASSSIEGV